MEDCGKYSKMTEDYIDGLLTDAEKAEFEKHINSCAECMNELNFSRSLRNELKKIDLPIPPIDFLENLNAKIDAEISENNKTKKIRPFPGRRSFSAVAACALIAVFLGVNANNELTKKISPSSEQTDMTFNDILKQDTNAASELLPPTENSDSSSEKVANGNSNKKNLHKNENKKSVVEGSEKKGSSASATQQSGDIAPSTAISAEITDSDTENQVLKNSENTASATASDTTETMVYSEISETDKTTESEGENSVGARTALPRGKNPANAIQAENEVFTVTVTDFDKAKKAAEEICTDTNGTYFMTAVQYSKFTELLHDAEIGYSSDAPDNSDVTFVLKEQS